MIKIDEFDNNWFLTCCVYYMMWLPWSEVKIASVWTIADLLASEDFTSVRRTSSSACAATTITVTAACTTDYHDNNSVALDTCNDDVTTNKLMSYPQELSGTGNDITAGSTRPAIPLGASKNIVIEENTDQNIVLVADCYSSVVNPALPVFGRDSVSCDTVESSSVCSQSPGASPMCSTAVGAHSIMSSSHHLPSSSATVPDRHVSSILAPGPSHFPLVTGSGVRSPDMVVAPSLRPTTHGTQSILDRAVADSLQPITATVPLPEVSECCRCRWM